MTVHQPAAQPADTQTTSAPAVHQDAPGDPYLSVAITAYNEGRRLPPSLGHILPYLEAQPYSYEVVVNDDGSADDTADVVRDFARHFPGRIRLVQSGLNEGKGAGLRRTILASRGRYVLFSDADFSTPIEELPRLLEQLDAGADVVIGSRIQPDGSDMRVSQPGYRRLFGQLFHRLADPLIVRGIADTQSGFKAFRGHVARELFRDTRLTSIIFDIEVLYLAQRRGYGVVEVPVQWTNAGGSRMRVTPQHAARVLWDLLRIPWLHRGPLQRGVSPEGVSPAPSRPPPPLVEGVRQGRPTPDPGTPSSVPTGQSP
ncbi:MAG: glycosyltransferase family 2 protein [Chloroflexota bacterium]|nr:glycosyltransferase family 2 protein [Chloroflexota bacterium]